MTPVTHETGVLQVHSADAKWANLCGVDLLISQQGNFSSKERLLRYASGKNNCSYTRILQQLFMICFFCAAFFLGGKPGGQICVVWTFSFF